MTLKKRPSVGEKGRGGLELKWSLGITISELEKSCISEEVAL